MARGLSTTTRFMILAPTGVLVLGAASRAMAAVPTYYADQMTFQSDITSTVTDDYSNPAYVFSQSNLVMSGVLGETDYMSTGFNNLNLVVNAGADPRYCAGCNGSFELSFQTTSVGNAVGVNGVGITVDAHDVGLPFFAFITFGDGTTDNVQLPAAGNFWGVAAPERIERIHFGLSMGVATQSGYFEIDNLIVGDGNIGTCEMDADCIDDGDPCTDTACVAGMCEYPFNVAPCDDGNMCTAMDTCSMGVCDGVPSNICDDGNPCTTDLCDAVAGCILQLNDDPCDDGSICTELDACSMGVCTGTPLDCDDGNVCSVDSCDPVMGCMSTPAVGCCLNDGECDPDQVCDLEVNECVPLPSGSTGAADTGMPDTGMDDTGMDDTGMPDTGTPGTGGTGGDSGVFDTDGPGPVTAPGSTGMMGGSDTGDPGELPSGPDGCGCRADPSPSDRAWWVLMLAGLGLRRRRSRAGVR